MRAILEQAIVHLLNEEQEKAEALFHKFIVERARQTHESLRQGDEVALSEGWDDEITSEEYFSEGDLDDVEDGEGEGDVDGAADDLEGDLDVADDVEDGVDADTDDVESDVDDLDADVEGENTDVDSRLDDIESHIEQLTAEFEEMMAKVDGELGGEGDEDFSDEGDFGGEGDDDLGDDDLTDGEDDFGEGDVADEGDDDLADRIGGDLTDGVPGEDEEEVEESFYESKKNPFAKKNEKAKGKDAKKNPFAKKNEKAKGKDTKKNPFAEAAEEHEDDLEDITESVMAELEKVLVSLPDGKEVGAAGTNVANKNVKSALPNNKPDQRQGGKPIVSKSVNHTGYERETAPSVKDGGNGIPKAKNVRKGNILSPVPAGGDKSALLHKDFAGGTKPSKSPVDGK